MKVNEIILEDEQLDEIKLRHAIAGAALAAGLASGAIHTHDTQQAKTQMSAAQKAAQVKVDKAEAEAKAAKSAAEKEKEIVSKLTDIVLDKYKHSVTPAKAKKIVELVTKYADPVFPKATDLLAVIGIESSFNPSAKSHLRHDKAIGLTQVRPKVWGIEAKDLKGNMDKQIEFASDILSKYYHKLGNKDKAIHAYNVGITNVRHHKGLNPEYVTKWKNELKMYAEI
jgi:soluble lytic murein transglycosylase-like protein